MITFPNPHIPLKLQMRNWLWGQCLISIFFLFLFPLTIISPIICFKLTTSDIKIIVQYFFPFKFMVFSVYIFLYATYNFYIYVTSISIQLKMRNWFLPLHCLVVFISKKAIGVWWLFITFALIYIHHHTNALQIYIHVNHL